MVVVFEEWVAATLVVQAVAWVVSHTSSESAGHRLVAEPSEALALALGGKQVFSALTDKPYTRPKDHPQMAMVHWASAARNLVALVLSVQQAEAKMFLLVTATHIFVNFHYSPIVLPPSQARSSPH